PLPARAGPGPGVPVRAGPRPARLPGLRHRPGRPTVRAGVRAGAVRRRGCERPLPPIRLTAAPARRHRHTRTTRLHPSPDPHTRRCTGTLTARNLAGRLGRAVRRTDDPREARLVTESPTPAGEDRTPSSKIDTTVPQTARIWNYWLGGKDNYAV